MTRMLMLTNMKNKVGIKEKDVLTGSRGIKKDSKANMAPWTNHVKYASAVSTVTPSYYKLENETKGGGK